MGCASSAPAVAADSGERQLSSPSPSTRQRRAAEASGSARAKSPPSTNTAATLATRAALTTVTPQARPPPRPDLGGGSSSTGGGSVDNNSAGLSSPLSSLEEPLSGSSTTKGRRGWRRGVGGVGGGDASPSAPSKNPPRSLARPASAAALALRVLEDDDDDDQVNKSRSSSSSSPDLPLTIVTDDYALGRVLGRGQFGTTRLATRRDSGEPFACKIILKRKLSAPAAVAAVRREVAIMRRLDHPSIVKLRGAYEDDRAVHLIVDLCQGGELFESIARNGKFSERCAARRARSMLETLRYLHGRGVVHRDLKPENFLLSTKDDEAPIKMIDFGLSAYAREDERLSDVVGTAYYMAPEVLRGRYGHKADIWSAGVICFIMLSGMPPFRGDTERAVFRAIVEDEPEFKGAAWRHVSSAAKETIAAMLRKDARKRPNAAELLRDFEWLEEPAVSSGKSKKRRTSIDAVAGSSVPAAAAAAAGAAGAAAAASASAAAASTAAHSALSSSPVASAFAALRLKSRTRPQPPLEKAAAEQQAPPPTAAPPPLSATSSSASSSSSSLGELSTPLDPAVKDSLRRFVGTDKLRRQATLLVAGRLRGGGAEQMAALRAACAALDAEGRGVISVDQLRDAIRCVATHGGGDHGASCAVVEAAKRAATGESAGGGGGGGAVAAKPATATADADADVAAAATLPPSSSSNEISRRSSHEEEMETEDDDTSCGCSLSSSMCDLAAAEEREQQQQQLREDQQQQQQRQRQQPAQRQQVQAEQLHQQLDLLQLEQHHLSSARPASAAVSDGFAGKLDHLQHDVDGVRDQQHYRQQQQQQRLHRHHRHSLKKHDCCSELGALLREFCDELREGCRLDYNKFVDYALQSSARVK